MSTTSSSVAVVGAGRLGSSLAIALHQADKPVKLGSRSPERTLSTLGNLGYSDLEVTTPVEAVQDASLVLITTADADIETMCQHISTALTQPCLVAHCSGSLNSKVLMAAVGQGAQVASCHPLNTFPSVEAGVRLLQTPESNTPVFCEGDETALSTLECFWRALGCKTLKISANDKTLYHAACVMACNYLVSLTDASLSVAETAGLNRSEFLHALAPILNATLNNIQSEGTRDALSGPIARGDIDTVKTQLDALKASDQTAPLLPLYAALGLHTLSMTDQAGEADQLRALLERALR